jgi:DNA-binding HxlR family transcriptional regulator
MAQAILLASPYLLLGMQEEPADGKASTTTTTTTTCAIVDVWEVLGRRWSLHIIKNLSTKEVIRFNELKRALAGISSTVLAERLLELEREGLVTKKIYPEVPPRVEYSMTPQARELEVIIKELARWANKWKRPEGLKPTVAAQKK